MIATMPGTNLTRDEAATRGSLLDVESYSIDLDLTVGDKVFESTTVIRFSCAQPGSSTFADLHGATVHEITLNGSKLDTFTAYHDHRIQLDGLQGENELRVHAELKEKEDRSEEHCLATFHNSIVNQRDDTVAKSINKVVLNRRAPAGNAGDGSSAGSLTGSGEAARY